jgi:hypothetical protein
MNKKGYYMLVDAIIGLFILTVGFVLLLSYGTNRVETEQIHFYSSDMIKIISKTKLSESNNNLYGPGGYLDREDWISDIDNTIIEQMGEFYYHFENPPLCRTAACLGPDSMGQPQIWSNLSNFVKNVTLGVMEEKVYNIRVKIDNQTVYTLANPTVDIDDAELLLPARRLVFGVYRDPTEPNEYDATKLWGPYLVEVEIWR